MKFIELKAQKNIHGMEEVMFVNINSIDIYQEAPKEALEILEIEKAVFFFVGEEQFFTKLTLEEFEQKLKGE